MLRHLETAPDTTGTRVRITDPQPFTAEEIADAIAELEKEQHHKSSGQNGVAQIASVLEQLHLDLPADAVTAQIEAKRQMRLQAKQIRRRKAIIASVATVFCCIVIVAFVWIRSRLIPPTIVETPTVGAATAQGIAKPVIPSQFLVDTQEANGTWITKTLGEVPDGMRVHLTADNIVHMMKMGTRGSTDTFLHDYKWQIFHKNGEWYLRAYTSTARSRNALLAEPISVYNAKDAMGTYHTVPVIVPLSSVVVENSEIVDGLEHRLDLRVTDVDQITFGK